MGTLNEQDSPEWHRHFAAVTNNRAWELATSDRSSADDLEMLNAAHASAYHWAATGDELSVMRARMLLAEVHCLVGLGRTAYEYAQEMSVYFKSAETPDWELAFTHTIHAHACYVAGKTEEYSASYASAIQAIKDIADEADRAIVLPTFNLVPKP